MSDFCHRRRPDGTWCGYAWSAHDGSAAPNGCRRFQASSTGRRVAAALILLATLGVVSLLITGVIP